MWVIAGKRANKTRFLKVFRFWPPSRFPELMGGHQSQGTHVLCQSIWHCASFCWAMINSALIFSLIAPFKQIRKSVFIILCHTQHPHTPTVFFLSFKHSLRDDSQKVRKWKWWYMNRCVHTCVSMYCLHKCMHVYLLLSFYLNNSW